MFDLGGVIVRWVGIDALAQLTGLTRETVTNRFSASDIFSAYEIGQCNDDVFAQELIAQFELAISLSEAKAMWNSWVQESYVGTKDMLSRLRKHYTLACLSNTNALHWQHLPTHINIEDYFDHRYASHLINAAKPNAESYLIPILDMDVSPSNICFFDDTLANVEAAKSVGMTAYHVDRDVGAIPALQSLGLLT